MVKKKLSGLAITSLVLGIFSLFFGWFPIFWIIPILAIVFGLIALQRMNVDKSLNGSGLATAGIVMGCFWFTIFVLLLLGFFV